MLAGREGVFGGWLDGLLVGGFGQVAGFVEGLLCHFTQLCQGGEGLMVVGWKGEFVRADLIQEQFQRIKQAGKTGISNGRKIGGHNSVRSLAPCGRRLQGRGRAQGPTTLRIEYIQRFCECPPLFAQVADDLPR